MAAGQFVPAIIPCCLAASPIWCFERLTAVKWHNWKMLFIRQYTMFDPPVKLGIPFIINTLPLKLGGGGMKNTNNHGLVGEPGDTSVMYRALLGPINGMNAHKTMQDAEQIKSERGFYEQQKK